jgi:hypothetical protein
MGLDVDFSERFSGRKTHKLHSKPLSAGSGRNIEERSWSSSEEPMDRDMVRTSGDGSHLPLG